MDKFTILRWKTGHCSKSSVDTAVKYANQIHRLHGVNSPESNNKRLFASEWNVYMENPVMESLRDLWSNTLAFKGVENSDQFLHRHLLLWRKYRFCSKSPDKFGRIVSLRTYMYVCSRVYDPPQKSVWSCRRTCTYVLESTCNKCVYKLCIPNSPFLQIIRRFTFFHCRLISFCGSGNEIARQIRPKSNFTDDDSKVPFCSFSWFYL